MNTPYKQTLILLALGCFLSGGALAQLSVASGERIKVTSTDELVVQEDLVNNGTIDNITLGGTAAQSISGTGTIVNLKVSKSAIGNIATITGDMQSIIGTLDLTAGTLAAGGYLKLKSSSAGTARVAAHTTAGTVTGTVYVERYIAPSRKKQWRMLGFPYSTALTIANITGIGMEFSTNTKTLMRYNEGADNGLYGGGSARNAGYVLYTANTEAIQPLTGVMAWLFGPSGSTASTGDMGASDSMTIVSSGTLYEDGNAVSPTINYTSANSNKGWNLIANPYASFIDWTSVDIVKTNLSTIYRYDPQNTRWTAYNPIDGSTNGGDKYIEPGASFFVLATAASPVLTIPQTAKVATPGSFFTHFSRAPRLNNIPSQRVPGTAVGAGVRVTAQGVADAAGDEVYVDLSRNDATPSFDVKYDAVSMGRTGGAGLAVKGDEDRTYAMQYDAPIAETGKERRYYPLKVTGITTGATSLTLRTEGSWNALNSVSLIDHQEGKTMLMRGNELRYDFQLESVKSEGRFTLAINHLKLDADGQLPVFDVKLLGNPVSGDRLDMIVAHPSAQASRWTVLNAAGQQVAAGRFAADAGVQHRVTVPGMRQTGTYLLKVQMDNGEEKIVPFIHK
jgi:hypothetical protein